MAEQKLLGKTILNIRPRLHALALTKEIEKEGGRCLCLPSIDIVPVIFDTKKVSALIKNSDFCIFVSQSAVKLLPINILKDFFSAKIVAIGASTAAALRQKKLSVDCVPEDPCSESVLNLPQFQCLASKKVTIFRGKAGRTLLDETLKQRGATIEEVIVYERILPVWTNEDYNNLMHISPDLALSLSVDSLTYFFSQLHLSLKKRFLNIPWLVMSQRVAEEAKKLGISTVYTVSKGDVLGSLIRCCSPVTIGDSL